nr:helix-turn-helix domain-containing protein [Spiroplasma endosymbiont of 'Nebria riversi']
MLYQNGKSIVEIIKEYGISKSAVYQWIENLNNFILFESPHKYGPTYCNLSKKSNNKQN